jgi:Carboxypeptidase regulatory-like domain
MNPRREVWMNIARRWCESAIRNIPLARRVLLSLSGLFFLGTSSALAGGQSIIGKVTDPQGNEVANTMVSLLGNDGKLVQQKVTGSDGQLIFTGIPPGEYTLKLNVDGFDRVDQPLLLRDGELAMIRIQLKLAAAKEEVRVSTDVPDADVATPDPAQRLLIREETLDANPGRPGAPVSIPGLPIETASGGIKAPQYFAPGVAGDHGEPIASYIQVGSYLVSNNLSSNAHGNGYADPNILVPQAIESIQVDGGAFNVREGNHSQNLSATYGLRSLFYPFFALTGDYRDLDLVAGWSPDVASWILLQASYGNGFLGRLEHRKQFKINGSRVFEFANQKLTLFGIGYYGFSYVAGLSPLGVPVLDDTIDPRQKDQTHTAEIVLNDVWRLTSSQQLQLSAFFRTYNLSLFSNFGDGLIRQSEFRTVTGGNATYINNFGDFLALLAGVDYQRDAPRRDDLDHYDFFDPSEPNVYGPFQKVSANNITIGDVSPYVAMQGALARNFRWYLGWRRDEINFDNEDLLIPAHSFQSWVGVNNPKATVSFLAKEHSWLPNVSLSGGEAFITNDPRIGTGMMEGTLVSRSHSYQLVASKTLAGTDFRLTLGHTTTEASLAKIDPDTGLQFDEGPGRLRYLTFAARHYFRFGLLQASVSKADARDLSDGTPTPEAPRLIVDALATFDHLPFHLRARSEFEYVGAKPLGELISGVPDSDAFGVPNTEVRGAVSRSYKQGRMDLGVNFLIAKGYTGQTTEQLEPSPSMTVVGVRLPSYVSVSYTYHFGCGCEPSH